MPADLIFTSQREQALTFPCDYCDAAPAQPCFDPRTGHELTRQPAHLVRLNARPEPVAGERTSPAPSGGANGEVSSAECVALTHQRATVEQRPRNERQE